MQPETLLSIAKANGLTLPGTTVEEVRELYRFRDFAHFIEVWLLTTTVLRTPADFRRVVTDYAAEAKRHGAVYLEGIFSPVERVERGVGWQEIFEGYLDGAQEAEERHGVTVRFTPDMYRAALQTLLRFFPRRLALFAVGKVAEDALERWGIECAGYVRHPAQGGESRFRAQFRTDIAAHL